MAAKYELPEEVNEKLLGTLGKKVELKTFKTNVPGELSETGQDRVVKIICVGDDTGGWRTKGTFIEDYLLRRPSKPKLPVIGIDFYLKIIRWKETKDDEPITIKAQLGEIGEQQRITKSTRIYFRGSHGALIFWGIDVT